MAKLQFTIIDYTSGSAVSTVVDEPVGLDGGAMQLSRNEDYHGFLGASDGSFASLRFYGDGYNILTNAYESYGIDAYLLFTIGYSCSDDGSYSQIYSGRFSFDKFTVHEGIEGCYCEAAIENGDDVLTFRNRIGQKVALDSRSTFDTLDETGSAYPELPDYTGLDQTILLNPLMVRMLNYATVPTTGTGSNTYSEPMDPITQLAVPGAMPLFAAGPGTDHPGQDSPQTNEFNLYDSYKHCISPFTNINAQEFGDFPGPVGDQYNDAYMRDLTDANPVFTFTPDIPYLSNSIKIDLELSIAIFNGDAVSPTGMAPDVCVYLMKGITWNDALNHRNILANGGKKTATTGSTDYYQPALDLSANAGIPGGTGITYGSSPPSPPAYNYNSLAGCSIFIDERYHIGPINNDFSTSPPTVGVATEQFSFHSQVWFNPGEQLFLFVQIDSHSSLPSDYSTPYNPQTVIYSGNYTYRNSYQIAASTFGSNKYVMYLNPTGTPAWVSASASTGTAPQPLSYLKLTFDSLYKPTECSAYMVNEALSRASEIITNGALPAYSSYFGRTDSQPYTAAADGPGALECMTNGLQIRGYSPLVAYYMGVGQFSLLAVPSGTSGYTLGSFATLGYAADTPSYIISFENTSANTLTVPADATFHYPWDGSTQIIIQQGTSSGVVTVQAAGGVTIVCPSGAVRTGGINSQLLLTKIAQNTWLLASKATMFTSFQEMVDALSAIHAVGFGLEPNTVLNDGSHWIRVEPISYFYQDTVVLTCENVDNTQRDTDPKNNIATLKVGYSKWEAEEAQGLDEFLSSREFRTTLSTLRAGWNKLCKFVASGYAIESTRRKLGTTTTDWRYDKDNFIMCVQRATIPNPDTSATVGGVLIHTSSPYDITAIDILSGGSGYTSAPAVTITPNGAGSGAVAVANISGGSVTSITVTNGGTGYTQTPAISIAPNYEAGYEIEQGSNAYSSAAGMAAPTGVIDSPSGMIDPTTVYNYRISPIRNALRWLRYVLASYVNQWPGGSLIFSEGAGNYYASGELATGGIESGSLTENKTLTIADYADSTITPVFRNELVKFKYPMGYADWQAVWANPYGLIKYNVNGGDWQYGWIQDLKYDLYGGMGEFTLKPQMRQ